LGIKICHKIDQSLDQIVRDIWSTMCAYNEWA